MNILFFKYSNIKNKIQKTLDKVHNNINFELSGKNVNQRSRFFLKINFIH